MPRLAPTHPIRRVRALRIARGEALSEVAEKLAVTEGHLSHIELGRRKPSASLARKLESHFGEPIDELLAVVDDEPEAALRPFLDALSALVRKQVRREMSRASRERGDAA